MHPLNVVLEGSGRGGLRRLLRTCMLARATLSGDVLPARAGSETAAINDMRYLSVSRFGWHNFEWFRVYPLPL